MVYHDLLREPEARNKIFLDEFGIEEDQLTRRIVVSPMPFNYIFPENYKEQLKENGVSFSYVRPTDPILSAFHGNLFLEKNGKKGFVLFLGRGVVEFTERITILSLSDRVEDILFLGSAGGLRGVKTGDLVVPEAVIPFENVSEVYVDVIRYLPLPDEELSREVEGYAQETGLNVIRGVHATVPLIYMETREFLEYLVKIGAITVDMELSAFFRILNRNGKRGTALLRVSDVPLYGQHFYSEEYERTKKTLRRRALESMLHVALRFLGLI